LGAHATYACSHGIVSRRLAPTTHYKASNLLVQSCWCYGVYNNNKHHVRLGFRMRWTQAPLFAEFYVQSTCAWIQFSWTHARPNNSLINYGHMHIGGWTVYDQGSRKALAFSEHTLDYGPVCFTPRQAEHPPDKNPAPGVENRTPNSVVSYAKQLCLMIKQTSPVSRD